MYGVWGPCELKQALATQRKLPHSHLEGTFRGVEKEIYLGNQGLHWEHWNSIGIIRDFSQVWMTLSVSADQEQLQLLELQCWYRKALYSDCRCPKLLADTGTSVTPNLCLHISFLQSTPPSPIHTHMRTHTHAHTPEYSHQFISSHWQLSILKLNLNKSYNSQRNMQYKMTIFSLIRLSKMGTEVSFCC